VFGNERCGVVIGGKDRYNYHVLMVTCSKIEHISIYHYIVNATTLNIWIPGSPFKCRFCPWNMNIDLAAIELRKVSIDKILDFLQRTKADVVSILGCEPLINEWTFELIHQLTRRNVKVLIKMTPSILLNYTEKILKDINCILLEISDAHEQINSQEISNVVLKLLSLGKHVEIHLVMNINDYWKCETIRRALIRIASGNRYVPIHFIPKNIHEEVNINELFKILENLKNMGYKFVYSPKDITYKYLTTICPKCYMPLILRDEFGVKKLVLRNEKCPFCGFNLKIKALKPISKIKVARLFTEEIVW